MSSLKDIKSSISEMSDEELLELSLKLRKSRRESKKIAKKKVKRLSVDNINSNQAEALLKLLGVGVNDDNQDD